MSLNYLKDPAAQVPNLAASGDGVDALLRYYEGGTDEVRNLLKNECSTIYECSYCRSLFRSIINFVAHKRTICRTLQSSIRAEHFEAIVNEHDREGGNPVMKRNSKNMRTLRRFNPVSTLSKHIRSVKVRLQTANTDIEVPTLPKVVRPTAKTTIVDGKQIIEELPVELAVKDQIPNDRTVLVMPSNNSIRCGEMQLRRRRLQTAKREFGNNSRELTPNEIAIIERIPSAIPVDFMNLRCEDERCVKDGLQNFHDLAALAHHLAIQHQIQYSESSLLKKSTPLIQCFLCDDASHFKRLADLQKHFNTNHADVRENHIKFRCEQLSSDSKRKEASIYRGRSLSPFYATNSSEETSIQSKQQESEGMKKRIKRKVEKDMKQDAIPEVNLTKKEEFEQQMEAASALKEWKKAEKEVLNPNGGDEEEGEQSSQTKRHDSSQIESIIDEEEARKIDQQLNSKTPDKRVKKTPDEDGSVDSSAIADEGPTHSLVLNRSPRPRRPNKKYQTDDPNATERIVKAGKSESPSKQKQTSSNTNASRPKDVRATLVAKKRTIRKKKVDPKRKLGAGKNQKISSKKEDASTGSTSAINPLELVEVPPIFKMGPRDFVLPDSIKAISNEDKATDQKKKAVLMDDIGKGEPSSSTSRNDEDNSTISGHDECELATPKLPSVITGRHKEELIYYTPKAQKIKDAEKRKRSFFSEPTTRRKQNLNGLAAEESDDVSVLGTNIVSKEKAAKVPANPGTPRPPPPPKPKDLASVPVYLTEDQRNLFFKPLKYLFNESTQSDGPCQCGECGEFLKNLKDGRRHMVSHIRVIRVRCSLCDAGAFFCSDMRVHLMYRHCEKINLAPEDFVSPGIPCMDKEKSDMLTQLVDPYNPGRVMYSTGKIVSTANPKAYFPDPRMERNILGPMLPGYLSPAASPKKSRTAILSPRKLFSTTPVKQQKEEEIEPGMEAGTSKQFDTPDQPEQQQTSNGHTSEDQTNGNCWVVATADHDYEVKDETSSQQI